MRFFLVFSKDFPANINSSGECKNVAGKRAEAQKKPTFATHCRKTIKIELAINDDNDDGREWS